MPQYLDNVKSISNCITHRNCINTNVHGAWFILMGTNKDITKLTLKKRKDGLKNYTSIPESTKSCPCFNKSNATWNLENITWSSRAPPPPMQGDSHIVILMPLWHHQLPTWRICLENQWHCGWLQRHCESNHLHSWYPTMCMQYVNLKLERVSWAFHQLACRKLFLLYIWCFSLPPFKNWLWVIWIVTWRTHYSRWTL